MEPNEDSEIKSSKRFSSLQKDKLTRRSTNRGAAEQNWMKTTEAKNGKPLIACKEKGCQNRLK